MEAPEQGFDRSEIAEPLLSEDEQAASAEFEWMHEKTLIEADRILALEGSFHVNGQYFANVFDAERQRMMEAYKRVRGRVREIKLHLNSLRRPAA